jgi:hypothetical protein
VHPTFETNHSKEFRRADVGSGVALTKRLKAAPDLIFIGTLDRVPPLIWREAAIP